MIESNEIENFGEKLADLRTLYLELVKDKHRLDEYIFEAIIIRKLEDLLMLAKTIERDASELSAKRKRSFFPFVLPGELR